MLACTDLLEATKVSMDPNPITTLIEYMHDVKKWITPHLNDLHGHRDPHCFKFVCNENGKCLMFFFGTGLAIHGAQRIRQQLF